MTKRNTNTINQDNYELDSSERRKTASSNSGYELPTDNIPSIPNDSNGGLKHSNKRENNTCNANDPNLQNTFGGNNTESYVSHMNDDSSYLHGDSNASSILNETNFEREIPYYSNRHQGLIYRARSRLKKAASILAKLDKTILEGETTLEGNISCQ